MRTIALMPVTYSKHRQIHVQTAKFLVIREVFPDDQARITFIGNGAKNRMHRACSPVDTDGRQMIHTANDEKIDLQLYVLLCMPVPIMIRCSLDM